MYKKALLLGIIGYIAGCAIGLAFALQHSPFSFAGELPDILLGGIPGAIAMGTAVIYSIEKWSLLRATATHFLIVMGVIFLACFVLKWFEPWSTPFWIMTAAEAVGYVLVWIALYWGYKAKVRKLNEMLKESREEKKDPPACFPPEDHASQAPGR